MSNQLQVAREQVISAQKSFKNVPNNKLDFEREAGFAMQMIQSNPFLASMDANSIRNCIVNVALTGLTLNPVLKLAYLVPRKGKLILDPSYMGLINVLVTSGAAKKIEADVVCENDFFDYEKGTNGFIKHKPSLSSRGEIIAAYAIAHLPNGEVQFEIMNREELEKVRKSSEAAKKGSSPYDGWASEMMRKAPIRRLFKYLPKHNIPDQVINTLSLDEQNNGVDFSAQKQEAFKGKAADFFEDEPANTVDADYTDMSHEEADNELAA
ncbi:recombinase RecT [Rufibacter latericius]|uniref:Recombinase RecT n=1 Tax=Rufibacter latericius TaxID=2487040 RepID=A0A3M9MN13_9BACT|nr:recombinase RecT [Rufibacter latericius]RNI26595.1 hypothetical protein EFB08_11290 [Rufibacter latericius]